VRSSATLFLGSPPPSLCSNVKIPCIMDINTEKRLIHFCYILGFIEFIVEPSMAVCSDMLESILGPIHSTCKPTDGAQQSISEDSETDRAKNGKL
jgi:hypothetical protein